MTHQEHTQESLGSLTHRLSEQVPHLVRSEIRLAQVELMEKGRRAGLGAGIAGAGGVLALLGLGALTAAAIMALASALSGWLAALLVGLVLLVAAGLCLLAGRNQVRHATPAKPELALSGVRDDLAVVKGGRE